MGRIEAAVRQARKNPSRAWYAKELIQKELCDSRRSIAELETRIRQLECQLKKADAPIAKVIKPFGSPPSDGLRPLAVMDWNEIHLYWGDEDGEDHGTIEWPFDRDYVYEDDLEAAGFDVEVA